ncbi:hypothetical protein [Streptomyces sp. NPDC050560]|uniref:hypothetical protein n=1 Tax=Streptomyces sp. NPDC050560 TaxID=3365630 RepID=UPI003795CA5B
MPCALRSLLTRALIALSCVLLPAGLVSGWAVHEVGREDRYVAVMAPLATDPAVRADVADAVTRTVVPTLTPGAGGAVGPPPPRHAVERFVRAAAWSFTGTPAFRTAWITANQAAHDAVSGALRGRADAAVRVDLAPVTARVRSDLMGRGVPFANRIPVTHMEVTVLRRSELAVARKGFSMAGVLSVWAPAAAAVFAVLGVLLALRRRRALAATALGMALGAAALLGAVAAGRGLTLADLPPDVSRAAAGAVYDALTSPLRLTSWAILAAGAAVAAATWGFERYGARRRGADPTAPELPPEPVTADNLTP